jgi:hypothetical protein
MTAERLWDEYREKCCPPDLKEPGGSLYWQRMAFLAGVTATIGNIIMRPACFEELRESLGSWLGDPTRKAESPNVD